MKQKIIVLGGSFNPPTIAHQVFLLSAIEALGADLGIFVPAPYPYVKKKMAKISENSIKVLNFLKDNHGKKMTSAEVAEALDLTTAQVNGTFTALSNKELGYREEATVTGTADISFLAITDEGKAADVSEISENGQKIMAYLKDVEGQNVTSADAADALEIDKRKFTGAFNALVKKGFAVRNSAKIEAPVTVKYLVLTDAGLAFDPTADAE